MPLMSPLESRSREPTAWRGDNERIQARYESYIFVQLHVGSGMTRVGRPQPRVEGVGVGDYRITALKESQSFR